MASREGLIVTTADGTVLYWSPSAEAVLGRPAAAAQGRSLVDLVVAPDGAEALRAELDEAWQTGSSFVQAKRMRGDGVLFPARVLMVRVPDPAGKQDLLATNILDLTQSKHLEEQLFSQMWSLEDQRVLLRTILDAIQEYAIMETDAKGIVRDFNESARRILAVAPDRTHGLPLRSFVAPDAAPGLARLLEAAQAEGRQSAELSTLGPATAQFPAWWSLSVRRDHHGQVAGFVVTVRDLSEEKKAEEARGALMRQSMEIEQLRKQEAYRRQFLNMAAHELATPLTPLKLQIELLQDAPNEEPMGENRETLDIMARSIRRMTELIRDLLEAARVESGKVVIRREAVDLTQLVRQSAGAFKEVAQKGGLTLVQDIEDGLRVQGDGTRLEQILFNLLSNAMKFTPSGGRVKVAARKGTDGAIVSVTDTGIGLTPEQISVLFRPFGQVHDPTKTNAPGTGLGLYITRGLVELHGGRVECRSDGPGKGTTFEVTLPAPGETLPAPKAGLPAP